MSMRHIFYSLAGLLFSIPTLFFAHDAYALVGAEYTNPLKRDSVDLVLTDFLSSMQGIIVTLAIVFIVIGALLYIFSAGDEGHIKLAKGAVTAAIIGLAIAIAAPSFLKQVYEILGQNTTPSDQVNGSITMLQIALNTLRFLLGISGTLAIIMMIVGGLMYLTAAGSESQIDTGKRVFKGSVIGIVIIMASMIIVKQLANFFL